MALALLIGTIFRPVEIKTSRAGKVYARLAIRERDGDAATFWNVTLFSESAIAEVEGLRKDDGVSVRGRLEATLYTPPQGGEARVSLSIVADAVLPLKRPPPKPRAPRERGSGRAPARHDPGSSWQAPPGPRSLDDKIPF